MLTFHPTKIIQEYENNIFEFCWKKYSDMLNDIFEFCQKNSDIQKYTSLNFVGKKYSDMWK